MKANWLLLVCFALLCLFLVIAGVPLLAQQSGSQHSTAGTHRAKQATVLEQRCRVLLDQLEKETEPIVGRSVEELSGLEMNLRECITDASSRSLRQESLTIYQVVRDAREYAILVDAEDAHDAELKKQHEVELKKQHDEFLEVARFTAALYKENEQRKAEELNLIGALGEEARSYRTMYNLAEEAINLAGRALNGSPGLSLPVFVERPAPQVIRVETPAVPKSLHCTSNTNDLILGGSTTWTSCWSW